MEDPPGHDQHNTRREGLTGPMELRRLLQQGRGRALLEVRSAYNPGLREAILQACLHDCRYDSQCEAERAPYLFEIIHATPEPDYYRRAVLAALEDPAEYWLSAEERGPGPDSHDGAFDQDQRLDLAVEFARRGDAQARRTIITAFERNAARGTYEGGSHVVRLDGITGMLAVVDRLRGDEPEEDLDQFETWMRELEQWDGKGAARIALENAASDHPVLRQLLHDLDLRRTELDPRQREDARRRRRENQDLSYQALRPRLHDRRSAWSAALRWSRDASDEELDLAARDLLNQEVEQILPYLVIFHRRPFPLDPERLLRLARCRDERVAWAAIRALRLLQHPDVRTLSLELLQDPRWCGHAVGLLAANCQPGDEQRVEQLFRQFSSGESDCLVHDAGSSLLEAVERLPSTKWVCSLLLLFEHGPCSLCRGQCVDLLSRLRAVPAWMIDECFYDAAEPIRKWASSQP